MLEEYPKEANVKGNVKGVQWKGLKWMSLVGQGPGRRNGKKS